LLSAQFDADAIGAGKSNRVIARDSALGIKRIRVVHHQAAVRAKTGARPSGPPSDLNGLTLWSI
jgi:hypothetical protein